MFSIITIKQLRKTLSLFEKNKITKEKLTINNKLFQIEKMENGYFKIFNEDKYFEIKISNENLEHFIINTSKEGVIREIEKISGKFLEGKQLWKITETVFGIKKFSFQCIINDENIEDLNNVLGFSEE
jgi:hypothetical protein